MTTNDIDRLRGEYARRRESSADKERYSLFNRAYLFAIQQRERVTLDLLRSEQFTSLAGKSILEVGCGRGGVLLEYFGYGADLHALTGVDLLEDRLIDGIRRMSGLRLICANGEKLPFPRASYDIVLQYTAFSSILDPQIKTEMAAEMLRVLQPDGLILWYDFWLNPTNSQTRGIRKAEIRRLFPRCDFTFKRTTLAPPIARPLVSISWIGAMLLERLMLLNTHYLVAIKPRS